MKLEEKLQIIFNDEKKMYAYYEYLKENLPDFMYKKDIDKIFELHDEAMRYNIQIMDEIAGIIDDSIGYQTIMNKALMRNLQIDEILE